MRVPSAVTQLDNLSKVRLTQLTCLLSVIYKIFTETLMLWLEKVMGKIINKCQSGFMKDRNIMSRVMAMHEIMHDTSEKERWSIAQIGL